MNIYPPGSCIDGRYEVAGRPLIGGMGIVYLCFDHQEQRPVALKTFKPECLPDRMARDSFLREGDTWIKLGRHPHIVQAYGVKYVGDGTEVYLVLELIAKEPGRNDASLRSWLTPGKALPIEQTLLFAMQIVRGMQHVTQIIPGFVHRDLKPENLLIGSDKLTNAEINRLRVTDFGLARVVADAKIGLLDTANTEHPNVRHIQFTRGAGTPLYMAPEQWHGEPLSPATDIYAFGCVLFEMLVGECIVEGKTISALELAHCTSNHRGLPDELPVSIRVLLGKCVAKVSVSRYSNWDEVEESLSEVYQKFTGHSMPPVEPVETFGHAEQVTFGWAHNTIGISYLDIGNSNLAVEHLERSLSIGLETDDHVLRIAAFCNLGMAYLNKDDTNRAINYYEDALAQSRENGNRFGEGNALSGLGIANRKLGNVQGAIEYAQKALVIHQELDDYRSQGADLDNLGGAYIMLGDARRSIAYYEQYLNISREISDRRGEGTALDGLGAAYKYLGDTQRAIDYIEQGLQIHQQTGDRRAEGYAIGNLGSVYAALGEIRRAIECYNHQLTITREVGDRYNESNALGNLGNAYASLGEMQRAIGYHEQRLRIAHEIGDRHGEGIAIGNLGGAYAALGEIHRAIECYEQHLRVTREIGDRRGEAATIGNLGIAYKNLGDPRRAIEYYEEQLAITREIEDRRGEGNALGNLGTAYLFLGNSAQAFDYYQQRISIAQEIGDLSGEAFGSLNIANIYYLQGDAAHALDLAQRARTLFCQIGSSYARAAERLIVTIHSGEKEESSR